MPTTANPPNPTVTLSGMSATAASKLGKILDFGIATAFFAPPAKAGAHLPAVRAVEEWVPAFAGMRSYELPQLHAFAVAAEEDVRAQEHRQHQRAVRRARGMAVALGAPDVIAGGDLAFRVGEAAFENKGLLDLDMLVQRQFGARLPAEQRGQQPGRRVLDQHLHLDAGARGRLPRQIVDIDIARRQGGELVRAFHARRRRGRRRGFGFRHHIVHRITSSSLVSGTPTLMLGFEGIPSIMLLVQVSHTACRIAVTRNLALFIEKNKIPPAKPSDERQINNTCHCFPANQVKRTLDNISNNIDHPKRTIFAIRISTISSRRLLTFSNIFEPSLLICPQSFEARRTMSGMVIAVKRTTI